MKVVTLLATVHDRAGALVTSLNREDLLVEEAGVAELQRLSGIFRATDLPLTIGLSVDTGLSERSALERERHASRAFLDQVLREHRDRPFVAHFDIGVEVLHDLTSSRAKLASAIDQLRIRRRGSTLLYRAVRECAERNMRRRTGRKAFVVLSDGFDVDSHTTTGTAIEYAQRADTMVHSILVGRREPLKYYPPVLRYNARGERAMPRLARETGGAYFEVSADNPIEKVYASIEEQLRNRYSIGYTP